MRICVAFAPVASLTDAAVLLAGRRTATVREEEMDTRDPWLALPAPPRPTGGDVRSRRVRGARMALIGTLLIVIGYGGGHADVARLHRENRDLRANVSSLRTELGIADDQTDEWRFQSGKYERRLERLTELVRGTVGDLDAPHFGLWNACRIRAGCRLTPGSYYVGGVPDTFTYHISFRSTVPVDFMIMSTRQFVCWDTGLCDTGTFVGWRDTRRVDASDFHLAEGCAGYLAVITSKQAGIFYPDISVTYDPAPRSTGVCR